MPRAHASRAPVGAALVAAFLLLTGCAGVILGPASLIPAAAQEKVYHLASLHTYAEVRVDGSFSIREDIGFQFDMGTFTYAYRDLPWRGFDALQDVSVEDESGLQLPTSVAFGAEPHAGWHIRWTYPSTAAPAGRTFTLRYTLTNALAQPSADRNRVDWMAIGTGWSVLILNASASVRLPRAAGNGTALAYSPLPANVTAASDGLWLNYTVGTLDPETGYRVIIDFPKFIDVHPDLLRMLRESPFTGGLLTFLLVLVAMIALWDWKGREPRVQNVIAKGILSAPPSDLRPGEVSHLTRQKFDPASMLGELLWLAKNEYLILRGPAPNQPLGPESPFLVATEKGRAAAIPGSPEGAGLRDPERKLLSALTRTTRTPAEVLQSEYGHFSHWMENRVVKLGLLESRPSKIRSRYGFAALGTFFAGFLLFIAAPSNPILYSLIGVIAGLSASSISIGSVGYFMPRLTQQGAEERARWRSFLAGIRWRVESLRQPDPEAALSLLDEYIEFFPLVPGLRLGPWLERQSEDLRGVAYQPSWFEPYFVYAGAASPTPGGGGVAAGGLGSIPSVIGTDFATFAHSFAAALGHFDSYVSPSGGGAVGGAGGGGGGGAGGGGGGAG